MVTTLGADEPGGAGIAIIQSKITDAWNAQLFPELCELNGWPPELAPTAAFADLETDDISQLLGALTTATGGQPVIHPDDAIEDYLRERQGLPPRSESPQISDMQAQDALGATLEADAQSARSEVVPVTSPQAALNGAQIASILDISRAVAAGELSREQALEIITTGFAIARDRAARMIDQGARS